ncbi:SDR family NAD(P)-dependent oxidoreductase [Devosia marina]|uniref:SDR family NAD(P)-dependent oxidoreductase n=1 Tax=Devosia marina TaxID=2683198 RepID=A0A7X3FQA4_9HYPH|nr:SDR family NAD(P)-dependent oxidoreductase [Devosia marina]MVS97920.1 SDR family NAD(P)-dependent oxidoreductase [Devosia marina]
MSAKTVIILGALSGIAEATARVHAARGDRLVLVARHPERLAVLQTDLVARGASRCETIVLDLASEPAPDRRLAEMIGQAGGNLDVAYVFYGVLGDQHADERDLAAARSAMQVNFLSAAVWCLAVANVIESQNSGVLIAISSVAGDRGRQSNYIYGAAKAGLTTLVEGIAHRLAKGKARALAIRMGFVDTPMTAHVEKKGALWSKPDGIAQKLVALADRPRGVKPYLPWIWRPIMSIIRFVPPAIFHRTKL